MEHLNGILFHKFGPANKQHTNQPIYELIPIWVITWELGT